ncbi:MAG TPA: hypothetical protein VN200_06125 [Rhodoglobus sp.]|nr:hypothetical protein [Rhodoglobus sp.]
MSALDGTWNVTISYLLGSLDGTLTLHVTGGRITGSASTKRGRIRLSEGTVDGDTATIPIELTEPMAIHATATITASGDQLKGKVSGAPIPGVRISGTRA